MGKVIRANIFLSIIIGLLLSVIIFFKISSNSIHHKCFRCGKIGHTQEMVKYTWGRHGHVQGGYWHEKCLTEHFGFTKYVDIYGKNVYVDLDYWKNK